MPSDLSKTEQQRLTALENIVEKNMQATIDCFEALMEIKNKRLFRRDYGTWKEYCQQRWQISPQWANKKIEAEKTRQEADDHSEQKSKNRTGASNKGQSESALSQSDKSHKEFAADNLSDRAASEAAKVSDPERRQAVIDQAAEIAEGKPTQKSVAQAIEDLGFDEHEIGEQDALEAGKSETEPIREIRNRVQAIGRDVKKLLDEDYAFFLKKHKQAIESDVKHLSSLLNASMPHDYCSYCAESGEADGGCKVCGGLGWIPKDVSDFAPKFNRSGGKEK